MPVVPNRPMLDDDAGLLIRPYTLTDGRTRPSAKFDHLTMVVATGTGLNDDHDTEHLLVLRLCSHPVAVAEIAALMKMPAVVIKVLLSDLVDCGAVVTRSVDAVPRSDAIDMSLLEAVLDGLRARI